MSEQGGSVATGLRYKSLALLSMVALGGAIAAFLWSAPEPAGVAGGVFLASETEAVARIADSTLRGGAPDFVRLKRASEQLEAAVSRQAADTKLAPLWSQLRPAVQTMLAQEPSWRRAYDAQQAIAGTVRGAKPGADDRGLVAAYQALAERLAPGAPGAGTALAVSAQLVTLERIDSTARRVLLEGTQARQLAATLPPLVEHLNHDNETLFAVPQLLPAEEAKSLRERAVTIAAAVDHLQENATAMEQLTLAASQLDKASTDLVAAATSAAPSRSVLVVRAGIAAAVIAVLSLLGFVLVNRRLATQSPSAVTPTAQDPQQQQAILKLLDEITNLANGDLTVDMTVTEDFTGAIADSINYTVQTLRGLVGTINQTSGQITASAASTQDVAAQLSAASETQATQVAATAETISAGAQSLLDIAARAERMAIEAQNSVDVAHNGAATVGRTIHNMAALREQIQDTAKRIKRLGESSQEVGSITEVINDLAEQTNTLALNASIQAKNAGEQNRGFALIADQVQELAERAASATRQIETLVKTIQADTGEAVISMERSTANVVAGATSAEEAGQALTRIEASSQELATSVQAIALSARVQSAESVKVAAAMQSLRVIAKGTSSSADRTSQAVTELNALADRLRESVAGFKLPDEITG